jgi:ankyrin repeat protein
VAHGQKSIAVVLLDAAAPIEALDKRHNTPLLVAASFGAESCVELLVKRGANLLATNKTGSDARKLVLASTKPKSALLAATDSPHTMTLLQ